MERYAFILLNIKRFWNRLCNQNRAGKTVHVFVRRGLVGPKNSRLLLFCVARLHKEIRGVGEFIERITGDSKDLWKTYCDESPLVSYEEYMGFLQRRRKAAFARAEECLEWAHTLQKKW